MKIISMDKDNIDEEHVLPLATILKIKQGQNPKDLGSPSGTLGIYYNGTFLTHELMTEKKSKHSFVAWILEIFLKTPNNCFFFYSFRSIPYPQLTNIKSLFR